MWLFTPFCNQNLSILPSMDKYRDTYPLVVTKICPWRSHFRTCIRCYEGEIDWYYQPVEVFIEVDTPGTKDAGLGFERFTRLYEDRERIDFKMKLAVAEVADYADRMSRDEFIEKSKIVFISVYSSGKRVFHIEHPRTHDGKGDAQVIYDEHDKTTVTEV